MSHSGPSAKIEVVYLIRWSNPIDLTRRFAESYLSFPAGIEHRLTLICKGFQSQKQIDEHRSQFDGTAPFVIEMPDVGYDIGAYRFAVDQSNQDLYCFLNSYSVICAPRWLESFSDCALDPRVGLVGATASYESPFSEVMARLAARRPSLGMLRHGIPGAIKQWLYFPPFPNPHIRTNAFMMRRSVLQRVMWPRSPSRRAALRFEAGRQSLTRQVQKMHLEVVVVGCDGRHYPISQWPSSCTFRQNGQHNVLVADNRTIEYNTATPERRRQLAINAWGPYAAG